MENRSQFQPATFKTREEEVDGQRKRYIEGYFVKYNSETELFKGYRESIRKGAFGDLTGSDIRVLWNHNHDLVLGRTASGTAVLDDRDDGLYGTVEVNEDDSQARDAYARIKRGDVSGCSFGFEYIADEVEEKDGIVHVEIVRANLFEVSPCVFPAYPQTEIKSRQKNIEAYKRDRLESKRSFLMQKLKGDNHD